MKFKTIILSVSLMLSALLACETDKERIDPVDPAKPGTEQPAIFPAGNPVGPQTQFTVTPEGGTFASPDKSVRLIIPAGAVNAAQQITMQPVENTAPAGSGRAVRLQPHGTQFEKPITIELSYAEIETQLTSKTLINIAYQNEKGNWLLATKPLVNADNKTVSVQTTHFSDWIVAENARLVPGQATIEAGDEITLHALQYVEDDLLAPLVTGDFMYMHYGKPMEAQYIKGGGKPEAWQLGGNGELHPIVNKAVYRAPRQMIEPMDVNVMIELFDKENPQTRHFLVSTIHVTTGAVMSYRINGGMWKHLPNAVVTELEPNKYGLSSIVDPIRVNVSWVGGVGSHCWNGMDEDRPEYVTDAGIINLTQLYFSHAYYETPDGNVTSSGHVKIDRIDKVKKIVEGTFIIQKAGVYSGTTGEQIRTEKIEGVFTANYLSLDDLPE